MDGHVEGPPRYPLLELTFADDDGEDFLLSGIFSIPFSDKRSEDLAADEKLRTSKPFRAFCILLLLAKFRGPESISESTVEFKQPTGERSWITTLGAWSKPEYAGIVHRFFFGREFIQITRGDYTLDENGKDIGTKPSTAIYNAGILPIQNLCLYKRSRNEPASHDKEIVGHHLIKLALKLENHEKAQGSWASIIHHDLCETVGVLKSFLSSTATRRPFRKLPDSNVLFTADWNNIARFEEEDAGEDFLRRLVKPPMGDHWYVVCISPYGPLLFLENHLHHALTERGVKVKWVYHSLDAVKSSPALQAQWKMIQTRYEYEEGKVSIKDHATRVLDEDKKALCGLVDRVRSTLRGSSGKGGRLSFYESSIVHYFMAFLAVPGDFKITTDEERAPRNTIGLVQHYPHFPANYSKRCGIYMVSPSPVLDLYYRSILKFFDPDFNKGYLQPASKMPTL